MNTDHHFLNLHGRIQTGGAHKALADITITVNVMPAGQQKDLLGALVTEVDRFVRELPSEKGEQATQAAECLEKVLKEATAAEPDRKRYTLSAEMLLEAAKRTNEYSDSIGITLLNLGKYLWPGFQLRNISDAGPRTPQYRIALFASSSDDTVRLGLVKEAREIDTQFHQSVSRDHYALRVSGAEGPQDLQRPLLEWQPRVVHFSGHGSRQSGLTLTGDSGATQLVSPETLRDLFGLHHGNIKLVFLSACYSDAQARAIAETVPCVVGTNAEIEDRAAIKFAAAFYRSFGSGHSVLRAFEEGTELLRLANAAALLTLHLHSRCDVDPSQVYLDTTVSDVITGRGGGAETGTPIASASASAFDRARVIAALKNLPAPAVEAVYAAFDTLDGRPGTPEQWVAWAETEGPGLDEFVVRAHRVDPLAGFLQKVRPETSRLDPPLSETGLAIDDPVQSHPDWTESASGAPDGPQTIPVLIAVDAPERALDVKGLKVYSRSGRIVAGIGNPAAIRELATHPHVVSVEASPPTGSPECANSVPFVRADAVHTEYAERGDRAVVGIIDGGVDVLHEAFLDDKGNSRIIAVWDQRGTHAPAPVASGHGFGTYHTREDIARYVANKATERGLLANFSCHGTHVASIAAGRACGGPTGFHGGMAPCARLVVVIPNSETEAGAPASLGYSVSHAAALKFIKWAAAQEPDQPPVVVNVSLGAQVGAHDGTSLLELMFDDFSGGGRAPGLIVVKSAGNDGAHGLHAVVPLNAGMVARLNWEAPPRDAGRYPTGRVRDLIDCWFSPFDQLCFRLIDPAKNESPEVSWANPLVTWNSSGGSACELRYERFHKDSGDSRLLIRVRGTRGAPILPGQWQLKITAGPLKQPVEFHAWIDRISDNQPVRFTSYVERHGTLSVPGTAKTVIAVGAVTTTDPIEVPPFASLGRTRDGRTKPEVSAPGVGVSAADSHSRTGVRPDDGTSMSAPHVTGAVALLLSHAAKCGQELNANQILKALPASTRSGNAGWNPGTGYGVIDVASLFQAFGFKIPAPLQNPEIPSVETNKAPATALG